MQDPTIAEYRHYLEHLRSERPHRLTEPEERILLEKSITGRSAFQRLFDETIGAATFKMELHGATQEMNLSEILAKQHDANRTVRAASAAALTAGMEERSRLLSYITNTLAHESSG